MAWHPDYDQQARQQLPLERREVFRAILEGNTEKTFWIADKKLASVINEALATHDETFRYVVGKNYDVVGHLRKIDLILSDRDKTGGPSEAAKAMETVLVGSLKLDRERVNGILTGALMPPHSPERDAAAILDSPMFASRRRELEQAGGAMAKLELLSKNNLLGLGEDLEKYRGARDMEKFSGLIGAFMKDVDVRYRDAIVTHATNRDVDSRVFCTSDRVRIDEVSKTISGDMRQAEKLSHTAATNTNEIQTHDYVFFNVYPRTGQEHMQNLLLSTRYLREKPEVQGSPYAQNACSFTFGLDPFLRGDICQNAPVIVALRDPVYPSGGTSAVEARKRMEQGGVATYVDCADKGVAKRKFGELQDTYETHRNVFAGKDIPAALRMNVEVGLYKTFYGLHQADLKNGNDNLTRGFYGRLHEAVSAKEGPEKDRAVMDIIKIYQYPQMLVAGSVPLEQAQKFKVPQESVEKSRVQPEARSAPAVREHGKHYPEILKSAQKVLGQFGIDKQAVVKDKNPDILAGYLDTLSQAHGALGELKFLNKNKIRATFEDGHRQDIEQSDITRYKQSLAASVPAPQPNVETKEKPAKQHM